MAAQYRQIRCGLMARARDEHTVEVDLERRGGSFVIGDWNCRPRLSRFVLLRELRAKLQPHFGWHFRGENWALIKISVDGFDLDEVARGPMGEVQLGQIACAVGGAGRCVVSYHKHKAPVQVSTKRDDTPTGSLKYPQEPDFRSASRNGAAEPNFGSASRSLSTMR